MLPTASRENVCLGPAEGSGGYSTGERADQIIQGLEGGEETLRTQAAEE